MAKIYLMRHAESIANTQGIFQGQSVDLGLSPLGQKQAEALGKRLGSGAIDTIISSPLKRTIETANPLATSIKKEIVKNKEIIETNHGQWENHDKVWIKENYHDILDLWHSAPSLVEFPGGEKFEETISRVKNFLDSYTNNNETAIFTHDNIVRTILALILDKSVDTIWEFQVDPAGVTTLEFEDNHFKLVDLNNTTHLSGIRSNLETHAL